MYTLVIAIFIIYACISTEFMYWTKCNFAFRFLSQDRLSLGFGSPIFKNTLFFSLEIGEKSMLDTHTNIAHTQGSFNVIKHGNYSLSVEHESIKTSGIDQF